MAGRHGAIVARIGAVSVVMYEVVRSPSVLPNQKFKGCSDASTFNFRA